MNSFELSRAWFNWSFENPEKIKPIHTAIYFFAIEHCNRLGSKKKFGFPSQMTMEAIGVKKHQTYSKAFKEIIEWGFIDLIQESRNQYSANIISISAVPKNGKARGKALDKAFIKHGAKQGQSTGQSKVDIDKPINHKPRNQETINQEDVIFPFDDFWNMYDKKVAKDKCQKKYNKLTKKELLKIKETLQDFLNYKPFADYQHPNPLTYLNQKRWNDEIEQDESNLSTQQFIEKYG